jgi:transcriptional regulator with XRE-family HTH domain
MPEHRLSFSPSSAPIAQQVGLRIRAMRRKLKWTLADLSSHTGLDKSFLSRLERGEKFGSVGTLHTIATALGCSLSTLLGENDPKEEIHIVRAGGRRRVSSVESDHEPGAHIYEAITVGANNSGLSVMVVEVGTHGEHNVAHHSGDELIFVLAGRVRVQFGTHTVFLERDDSVRFPGYLPHSLCAEDHQPARALIIISGDAR